MRALSWCQLRCLEALWARRCGTRAGIWCWPASQELLQCPRLELLWGLHAWLELTCLKLLYCIHQQLPCCLGMLHISLCSLTAWHLHRGFHWKAWLWRQAGIPIPWITGCQLDRCSFLQGKQQLITQIYKVMVLSCLLF